MVAAPAQRLDEVAADEAAAAGDEDSCDGVLLEGTPRRPANSRAVAYR
jgi:hypothetical protein